MKVCPYCAEKIQEEAAKCRFCGEWLDPNKRPAWSLDFAALGEQLGRELSEAAERGELTPEVLGSIRAAVGDKLHDAPSQAAKREPTQEGVTSMASPAPASVWSTGSEESGGQVAAWEPPTWLSPPATPAPAPAPTPSVQPAPDRSEAPTRPEAVPSPVAANQEPSPQFVPPGRAATAAAMHPEAAPAAAPTARAVPPTEAAVQAQAPAPAPAQVLAPPADRASLEEVAARMERLKATADAVQRTLAEKAAERSASASGHGDAGAGDSVGRMPSRPAIERSGTLLQGSRVPGPEEGARAPSSRGGKRSGTMDRLEQSILGDDHDDFGDLDAEGSGVGSTSFGDAISSRRPLPWAPIAAGVVVVAAIGYFMFRDTGAQAVAQQDPGATTQAADTSAAPPQPDTKADTKQPDSGEPPAEGGEPPAEGGEPAAEGGEPAAEGGEPAADTGEPPAEGGDDGGAKTGDDGGADTGAEPPPADEALTQKLAEAEKAYKRRKYDAAKAAIDEAMAMSKDNADALVILANVQLEQGEMEPALATATKCVSVDPSKADCWLTIAALQEANKNPAEALAAWRKYLEHAPSGQYASSAKKAVKRLEKQVEG